MEYMNKTNKTTTSTKQVSGISFTSLLAILFIGLKLTGVINWSWLWVLSPIWIPIAIVISIAIALLAFYMLSGFFLSNLSLFFDKSI
jgi:hypothetical protein